MCFYIRLQFPFQIVNKLGNPAVVLIVFLTVTYEDVTFVAWDYA